MDPITPAQFDDAGLDQWRMHNSVIVARFDTGNFDAGVEFLNAVAVLARRADHHPDILLTFPSVEVRLTTHDAGGVTTKDTDLAQQISDLAAEGGITADQAG